MKKKALTPKAKHWLAVLLSAIVAISAAVPGTLTTAFAGENGTVDYSYNSGNEDGTGSGEDGTDNGEDGTDNGEDGTGSAVNGNIDFGAGIGDTYSNADDAEEIRVYVSDELKAYVKSQFTSGIKEIAAIHLEYGDQHVTTTTPNLGKYYSANSLVGGIPGDLDSTNYDSYFDGVTFLDGAASEKDHVYFSLEDLKVTREWKDGKVGLIDWDILTYRLDLGDGANTTWVTYYANYENADPKYLHFSAEIGKTHRVHNYGETGLKAWDNYKFQGWTTVPSGTTKDDAFEAGKYINIESAVNLYAVWKEDDGQSSYTVTHKFADGTPAEVSFTGGQKEVSQSFETPAQKLKAQEITKGYVITKIEVWENSALKTEYKGNYEYMNTYLTKDVPVELVYHVEKKEDPDTSTPSEPDTSDPDDGGNSYPPRPRPNPDDDDDETVIPDESTPLAPGTDDGTGAVVVPEGPGGDDTVIDDDDVPLASLPTEEIDGDETPVTNPPKTGVKTAGSVALLAGSLAVALATLKKRNGDK